jgi:hypothetical protein
MCYGPPINSYIRLGCVRIHFDVFCESPYAAARARRGSSSSSCCCCYVPLYAATYIYTYKYKYICQILKHCCSATTSDTIVELNLPQTNNTIAPTLLANSRDRGSCLQHADLALGREIFKPPHPIRSPILLLITLLLFPHRSHISLTLPIQASNASSLSRIKAIQHDPLSFLNALQVYLETPHFSLLQSFPSRIRKHCLGRTLVLAKKFVVGWFAISRLEAEGYGTIELPLPQCTFCTILEEHLGHAVRVPAIITI